MNQPFQVVQPRVAVRINDEVYKKRKGSLAFLEKMVAKNCLSAYRLVEETDDRASLNLELTGDWKSCYPDLADGKIPDVWKNLLLSRWREITVYAGTVRQMVVFCWHICLTPIPITSMR
jgi:hypothetical protein